MSKQVIVVGGGAAGYFAAISCALHFPEAKVTILEKNDKVLSKVRISGGGRCNVTNANRNPTEVAKHYPRGEKFLKKAFQQFCTSDTVNWFESRGIKLVAEQDGRIFPASNTSETIVNCLLDEARRLNITTLFKTEVEAINKEEDKFRISLKEKATISADRVIVCAGGYPKPHSYEFIASASHTIVSPVPSLFTFNIPTSPFKDLMGVSDPDTAIKVAGLKGTQTGPCLITHWGLSGPAVLKTSAWHARALAESQYTFQVLVNWASPLSEQELTSQLEDYKQAHPKQQIAGHVLFGISRRLWERLCGLSNIEEDLRWCDITKQKQNALLEHILRQPLNVIGKTTFKEEFVTCGGVNLQEVSPDTLESKLVPGLFFAGEVLDIDGITGGYNFQAAWTTGWIAGKNSLL